MRINPEDLANTSNITIIQSLGAATSWRYESTTKKLIAKVDGVDQFSIDSNGVTRSRIQLSEGGGV